MVTDNQLPSLEFLRDRMRGLDVLASMAFMTTSNNFWSTQVRRGGVISITQNTMQGAWCQLECNAMRGFFVGEDSQMTTKNAKRNEMNARSAMKKLGREWAPLIPKKVRGSLGWTFAFAIDGRDRSWSPLVAGVSATQVVSAWWMRECVDESLDARKYCRDDLGVDDIEAADDIVRLFPMNIGENDTRISGKYLQIFEAVAARVGYPVIRS